MLTPEQVAYIEYRLTRAETSMEEARVLFGAGLFHATVNRLYYACFYAVTALVYTEGRASSKHSGIKSMFDRYWVKTGQVSSELGRFYRDLFDLRQDSDYGEVITLERPRVESLLAQAEEFVKTISAEVRERLADESV